MSERARTLTVAEMVSVLRRRTGTVACFAAGVLGASLAFSWCSEPQFQAEARLFLGELPAATSARGGASTGAAGGVSDEIEVLKSDSLLEHVLSQQTALAADAARLLDVQRRLRVFAPRGNGSAQYGRVVVLQYADGSAERATDFLRELLRLYLEQRAQRKVQDAGARARLFESEFAAAQVSLDAAGRELATFRARHRGLGVEGRASLLEERLERYGAQQAELELELERLLAFHAELQRPTPSLASFLRGESSDARLTALGSALLEADRDRTALAQLLTETAPELREQDYRVAGRARAIQAHVDDRLSGARARRTALQAVRRDLERELRSERQVEFAALTLTEDQRTRQRAYLRLLDQRNPALLVSVSKDRVLDVPFVSRRSVSTLLWEQAQSALLGLLLGAQWVLFRHLFSGVVENDADVRRGLGPLPVLGRVPRRRPLRVSWLRRAPPRLDLELDVPPGAGLPAFGEAFRLIATSLQLGARSGSFSLATSPGVMLITSPGRGDGKTTCARALAAAFARAGRRVLLAQLDLDASPLPARADSVQGPGLSDVLAGRCPLAHAICFLPVGTSAVHCLGPGRGEVAGNAAWSERLDAFVREMRRLYDHILLDVAAEPHAFGHASLALAADLRISVVRLGHTRRKAFEAQCLAWRAQDSRGAAVIVGDYAA